MQAELFSGTYQALQVKLTAIIGGGRVINDVIKLNGGIYMILHT